MDAIQFGHVSITFDGGDARKLHDRSPCINLIIRAPGTGVKANIRGNASGHRSAVTPCYTGRVNVTGTTFPVIFEPNYR